MPLKILHLTDIHYSTDYQVGSSAACGEPLCCRNGTSPSNGANAAGHWGDYRNCDTPWHVLVGTVNQIVTQHRNIDFIYFTGDIVDHKVWDTSVDRNTRAIIDVFSILRGAFRSVSIFPTLGNHETHPVNVFSPSTITGRLSTQWVFDLMRTEWRKWLPSGTQGTISKGGYYTVLVKPGFRIIALNSNVCFTYNWWLLYDDVDPYDQLKWLVLVLFKAERNNEIVHILSHVPSADSTCLQNWSREFSKIILRFSHIIAAQFNGHTHAKENIIYYEGNDLSKPVNVAFNGGSLTPYSDFNPNYVVYDVNRRNFEVMDYQMWIYDISKSNLDPNRHPLWFKLYSFTDAYRIDRISPQRMNDLVQNMTRDCNLSNQYFRLKYRDAEVSTSKGCNRDCVTENVCYMVTPYYKYVHQCNLLKESLDVNYNCNFH